VLVYITYSTNERSSCWKEEEVSCSCLGCFSWMDRKSFLAAMHNFHALHHSNPYPRNHFSQVSTMSDEAAPAPAPPTCAKCATPSHDLKPCLTCKSVSYCSRDCKKADAKAHKTVCAKAAQEYMKTADIKMASKAPPKSSGRDTGFKKWQFDT